MTTPRYFLDVNPDCWYVLIPAERRAAWVRWCKANDDKPEFTLPSYAVPLKQPCRGDGSKVTFTDPRDAKGNPLG